ncbi:MAG: HD-GYP domain-containing protein [Desulfuromonadales bacterium]|nr:HD-GYP domain-containing protein [Desulfuromonadales bacterium]
MTEEIARQLVQGFVSSLKGLKLYPLQHPALARQIQTFLSVLQSCHQVNAALRIGLHDGVLVVDDLLISDNIPAAEDLSKLLQRLELTGLQFDAGMSEDEFSRLLSVLTTPTKGDQSVESLLATKDFPHVHPLIQESEQETLSSRAVYGRALKVVDNIFQDVRLGKIPSSAEAVSVMGDMVKLMISEPDTLFALSMLKDYDNYTFTHSVNVSVISLAVGRACGLNEEQLRTLGLGALLHDLGKLKVDVAIITKPGRLTAEEFAEIKKHPGDGAALVVEMEGISPEVVDIVLGHHLRFDRSGYPGSAQRQVMSAMIDMTAIADTYDALTTLRSYQRPQTPRNATEKLREIAGTALHPDYVEKFILSLGTYPVGTLVRLDSNEIGLVIKVEVREQEAVKLKILFDSSGNRLTDLPLVELIGAETARIVGEVDPFTKGVDVTEYF